MKKMLGIAAALGGLALASLLAGPAQAETRIDERQAMQQRRIQHGLATGALTPGEARVLQVEQARIARMERLARADGWLTPAERWRLERAQDQASRDIYRLARNDRVAHARFGAPPRAHDHHRR